jgi:hypothetical protein
MKRNQRNSNTVVALAAVALALLSGCVNLKTQPKSRKFNVTGTTPPLLTDSHAGYSCPSSANVTPHDSYDWDNDPRTDYYTVCRKTGDWANLLILGENAHTSQVCIFPVSMTGGLLSYYTDPNADTTGGRPWAAVLGFCSTTADQGMTLSFGSVSYSHLLIVSDNDAELARQCLYSGWRCVPPREYSFGEILGTN